MVIQLEGFKPVGEILRSGIYALIYQNEVVYIGKSKKMLVRIYTHKNNWGKKLLKFNGVNWASIKGILFDDVHVMPCRLEVLDIVEQEMINLYKPKHNVNLKKPTKISAPITLNIRGIEVTINKPRPQPQELIIERRL